MSEPTRNGLRVVRDGEVGSSPPPPPDDALVTCTERGEDVVVVTLVGDFDIDGTDTLRRALTECITEQRHKVVVDLSRTAFMDSMALGALIGAAKRAQHWGGWLRLVGPTLYLRKVLRVTGLDAVYGVYDDVDEAVEHPADGLP